MDYTSKIAARYWIFLVVSLLFLLTPNLLKKDLYAGPYTVGCANDSDCKSLPSPCGACADSTAWCELSTSTCKFTCFDGGACSNVCTSWQPWYPDPCTGNWQTRRCINNPEIYQLRRCEVIIPPGCSVGGWVNQGCGAGSCAATDMLQTRVVNPGGCGGYATTNCVPNHPTCVGGTPSSCSFNMDDVVLSGVGDTKSSIIYDIVTNGGNITSVDFESLNTSIASVTSPSSAPAPFSTQITGQSVSATGVDYIATATMDSGAVCQNQKTIRVMNPGKWIQVKSGSVMAIGDVSTTIPATCTAPGCDPYLIAADPGEAPGVAIADGNINTAPGGQVSSTDAKVEGIAITPFSYNFNYFYNKTKNRSVVSPNPVTEAWIKSSPTYLGYHIVEIPCPAMVSGNLNMQNHKTILIANCDIRIDGKINVDDGRGYMLMIANGDINVDSDVSGAYDATPDLEGQYFCDGNFDSGTLGPGLDNPLQIRGSVAANNVSFTRDLLDNSSTPGVSVEYGPDQYLMYPGFLTRRSVAWREVAP